MLNRLFITLIILSFLGAGVWGYFYFKKVKAPASPVIAAIPKNAALIFESKNARKLMSSLSRENENEIWNELVKVDFFSQMNKDFKSIDSLFSRDSTLYDYLSNEAITASSHVSGTNNFNFLFLLNVTNFLTDAYLVEVLKGNGSTGITQRIYEESTISTAILRNGKSLSFSLNQGILVSSFSSLLIEESIRQLKNGNSLLQDPSFQKVSATKGSKVEGNVYVNYKNLSQVLSIYGSEEIKKRMHDLSLFADWAALDLKIKKSSILFTGFTNPGDLKKNFLPVFLKQKPQEMKVVSFIPTDVSQFTFYGISSFKTFHFDYLRYLENNNMLFSYKEKLNKLNQEYKIDAELFLADFISTELTSLSVISNDSASTETIIGVFKLADPDKAQSHLALLDPVDSSQTIQATTLNEKKAKETAKKAKALKKQNPDEEEYKDILIKRFKVPSLFATVLSGSFEDLTSNYFCIINDYILTANSSSGLKKIIDSFRIGKTLKSNPDFKEFMESFANESNIFIYANLKNSENRLSKLTSKEYQSDIRNKSEILNRFEAVAIQFSSNNDLFYHNIQLKHNPVSAKVEANYEWELELEASLAMDPIVVRNHITKEKELFCQDQENNIYLVSASGVILFKKELGEPVFGVVEQVDALKNNKLQFLFNTASSLHLIDRNGNYVEGYPVKFKSNATNSITVFDYENKKDYRIIVAGESGKIYNYNIEGLLVTGWVSPQLKGKVTAPVKHVELSGKDYLTAVDVNGVSYLFDRKGETRIELQNKISCSGKNRFFIEKGKDISNTCIVCFDSISSTIKKLYFDDRKDEVKPPKEEKLFYLTVNSAGKSDIKYLISTDKLIKGFGEGEKVLFSYAVPSTPEEPPVIFNLDKRIVIGVNSQQEVHLLSEKGVILDGFPVSGGTHFTIIAGNKGSSLITGLENKMYKFPIQIN